MSVLIVTASFLLIAQDFVGFSGLFEHVDRISITLI